MFSVSEFFAGSGLVRSGLYPDFETVWANDICERKRATYVANFGGGEFHLAGIEDISGGQVPACDLAWASFPCQDLSLAGNLGGMFKGTRSGLFWEWIRVLREMKDLGTCPSVVAVENVVGFVVADGGRHFREAYEALRGLGYKVGALEINAKHFVAQSRARAFMVAVRDGVALHDVSQERPGSPFHTRTIIDAARNIEDGGWVWWSLPTPTHPVTPFSELRERNVEKNTVEHTAKLLGILSPAHRRKLEGIVASGTSYAGTAYRRTRQDDQGVRCQRLELRFDGFAGCLRTPNGGSSRQTVIEVEGGQVTCRLMTARECARLMGAPDSFKLPGTYNDAYRAMGDGVAIPVTRWLSRHLLSILASRAGGLVQEGPQLKPTFHGSMLPFEWNRADHA